MKTISGKLVSVQPISLSKAARYISDFTSFENNGASEVVSIYLSRASEAFSSLVQLKKEVKNPQSSRKKDRKRSCSGGENGGSLRNGETVNCDRLGVENGVEKGNRKDEEKKAKRRKGNEIKEEQKEVEMEVEQGKKNRKKKRDQI